ncbi:MAG: Ca-activated chloride channel, partial [Actinoplanes sp.]|nr:Ca-activated chloride channel [Actinoplanes sp.]
MVAIGLRFGLPMLADAGCTGQLKLTVAVAEDIAPVVRQTAQAWSAHAADRNGPCITVAITAAEPSDVAAAISREQKASLSGLDTATGTVAVPD